MSPDRGPESHAIEVNTEFIPRCEKVGVATTNLQVVFEGCRELN